MIDLMWLGIWALSISVLFISVYLIAYQDNPLDD